MTSHDFNDEQFINDLVDKYKESGSQELKLQLLKEFDPYFKKYSFLLCSNCNIDLSNKDTMKFIRLFTTEEDRKDEGSLLSAAKRVVDYLRRVFKDCTKEDIYDEMVCAFLEHLERYKPMIANHKHTQERISFTHFIQVSIRFSIKAISLRRERDALSCSHNLEYNDDLNAIEPSVQAGDNWSTIDLRWIHGITSGEIFTQLTEMERYLLYLKYENDEQEELSDYELARITGLDRMYVRRKVLKIKDKLKQLVDTI